MAAKSDEFSPQRKRVKNNEISSSYSSSKRYAEASTVTKRKREFEEEDDKDDQIFEPQRAKQVKVTNVVSPVEKGDPEGRLKTTENDTTNNARNEPVEDDLSEEYLKPIERKEFVVTEPEHYPTVEERKRDENKAHGRLKGLLGAISKSDSPAKEDVKHVPAGPSLTIVEPVKLIPQPTVTTTVTITSTVELFKPIQVSGGPVTVALTSTINLATTVEPKLVFAGATSVTAAAKTGFCIFHSTKLLLADFSPISPKLLLVGFNPIGSKLLLAGFNPIGPKLLLAGFNPTSPKLRLTEFNSNSADSGSDITSIHGTKLCFYIADVINSWSPGFNCLIELVRCTSSVKLIGQTSCAPDEPCP
ncbi:hypothetical protein HDE_00137 [Halotydeus destructor]|nr:hypothetical protein HDE_00137 [Halotydeus destructor]